MISQVDKNQTKLYHTITTRRPLRAKERLGYTTHKGKNKTHVWITGTQIMP